jgi:hypothetical protein
MGKKIQFYGDAEPSPVEQYVVIKWDDKVRATDFTETGIWIASGTISGLKKRGVPYTVEVLTLKEIFEKFPEDMEIETPGIDIWANYVERRGIKKLVDLKRALGE